jgi:hypothetical protein
LALLLCRSVLLIRLGPFAAAHRIRVEDHAFLLITSRSIKFNRGERG